MKSINATGLVALATSLAIMLAGTGTAMAESTALCSVDPLGSNVCPSGYLISHIHEATSGFKAKILTSFLTVECDVLFLGDVKSAENLGSPLVISGNFTYSNCGSCTITEEHGPAVIKILKEAHEYARVTPEFLIHVKCSTSLDCAYTGFFLSGGAYGPLLSILLSGETQYQLQWLNKEAGGFLCPKSADLDIWLTPLSQTDITN